MNLTIDIGNSKTKLTTFQENKICNSYKFNSLSEISDFSFKSIKKIICCSVNKSKKEIENNRFANIFKIKEDFYMLKNQKSSLEKDKIPFYFLSKKTPIPISTSYKTTTLGNDRIALAVAASQINPNINSLIIDCGTCITYDFINKKGQHKGGSISPGLQMRYDALNHYTKNLPHLSERENTTLIGETTKSSMSSGVINGIIEELNGIICRYKKKYNELKVLVTGGDMDSFVKNIKNDIFADPLLLAKGLNYILEYNAKK